MITTGITERTQELHKSQKEKFSMIHVIDDNFINIPFEITEIIHKKSKTPFKDILYYGIYVNCIKMKEYLDANDCALTLLFLYYHKGLPENIFLYINDLIKNHIISSHLEFKEFIAPVEGRNTDISDFEECISNNSKLKECIYEFCTIEAAKGNLVNSIDYNSEEVINVFKMYSPFEKEHTNHEVIKADILFEAVKIEEQGGVVVWDDLVAKYPNKPFMYSECYEKMLRLMNKNRNND